MWKVFWSQPNFLKAGTLRLKYLLVFKPSIGSLSEICFISTSQSQPVKGASSVVAVTPGVEFLPSGLGDVEALGLS